MSIALNKGHTEIAGLLISHAGMNAVDLIRVIVIIVIIAVIALLANRFFRARNGH